MAFLFAWIASLGFGLETIIGKLTSKHTLSDPWAFNFFYPLVILLFTIPVALFNGAGIPTHWTDLTLAAFFQAIAFIFFVLSLFKLDVSVFSPLFNFRSVFSVLLATVFLNETLTAFQYMIVAVIFFAGLFVSMDEKFSFRSFFSKPVGLIILDTIFWSIMGIFVNKASSYDDFWTVTLWMAILTQVFLLFTIPLFYKDVKKIKSGDFLGVFAMGIAGVIGSTASVKAFTNNVGISTVIMSLPVSMIMAFLFAILAPKLLERHSLKVYLVRFTAAAVMIAGALKLSS